MVDVKNLSEAEDNYVSAASGVKKKYERGIKGAEWSENASSDASEDLYQEKLRASMGRRARQKAIAKIPNSEWQNRSLGKGASAIVPAMQQSGGKWRKGFQPYADELTSIKLPDRVADPEQNVINRVVPIAVALAERKIREQS